MYVTSYLVGVEVGEVCIEGCEESCEGTVEKTTVSGFLPGEKKLVILLLIEGLFSVTSQVDIEGDEVVVAVVTDVVDSSFDELTGEDDILTNIYSTRENFYLPLRLL